MTLTGNRKCGWYGQQGLLFVVVVVVRGRYVATVENRREVLFEERYAASLKAALRSAREAVASLGWAPEDE